MGEENVFSLILDSYISRVSLDFNLFESAKMFGLVSLLGAVHLSPLKGEVVNGSDKATYVPSSEELYVIRQIHDASKRNYERHKRNGDEEAAQVSLMRMTWTSKYLGNGHSE